ncbi:MAG: hypothetical protein QXT74_04800 [Candidatus Nezhaarchaeales archaeon]
MPSEVFDAETFLALSERAKECRVVRRGDLVKLKLRTPSRLYTLKAPSSQASEILSKIKCPVVEIK